MNYLKSIKDSIYPEIFLASLFCRASRDLLEYSSHGALRYFLGFMVLCGVALFGAGCTAGGGSDGGNSNSSEDDPFIDGSDSSSGSDSGSTSSDILAGLFAPNEFGTCAQQDLTEDQLNQLAGMFDGFVLQRRGRGAGELARDGTVEIPVIFHIIMKGSSVNEGNLPDSMINAQIQVLNNVYAGGIGGAPTPYRFRLAAIDRQNKPEWFTVAPASQTEIDLKAALHQGGPETLNIYTVDTENKILGFSAFPLLYAFLPSFDGVVVNFQTLPEGPLNHYNRGHVIVHEVGHWLGLLHTFQGECNGFFGDLVEDTPAEKIPSGPEFCPANRDSCPDQVGVDPVHNHMTYTDDDCRSEFTPGQLQLMQFNTEVFRGLVSS